jgi:replicative DNA helicase
VPFDLDYLNKITKGGLPNKTLNVILAGTGVGKSLFMCHCAAANLSAGLNVLYITMEMAEERIAERIDANLLNVSLDELTILPRESYDKKIERVQEKTNGKLIIKEYPTASAGAGHMRHLLNELKLKRNFHPDIVYIDYLNICSSSRLKYGANVNSYTYIKAIAEELRGLAVEFDVPIVTATQTTRSGFTSSDLGLEDTSESFGLPATADFMIALISSEELQDLNQMMVKQLKNRYNDPGVHRRFVIGVDRPKMKLYDVEQSAQQDIVDDGPVFDKSDTGIRIKSEKGKFKDAFNSFS